jgi:C4-dicarboxylate transporter, DctQ subunit
MLRWLDAALCRIEEGLVAVLLGAAALVLFLDVAARYLFSAPFSWGAESVRYAIIWVVFIGSSIAARRGIHISISALREFLPAPAQRPLILLVLLICCSFSLLLLYASVSLIQFMRRFSQVTPALEIPMWWVYLAIPVGAGLMSLRFTQALWAEARHRALSEDPNRITRELVG